MAITKPAFLASIVGWLRKGYPQGVPQQDYIALLALMHHRLTEAELRTIVGRLIEAGDLPVERDEIAAMIEQITKQEPTDDDLSRVAARLAAGGWPLAAPIPDSAPESDDEILRGERQGLLQSVLGWLRAGYPDGIPENDYIPIVALLARRLSDDEIKWVSDQVVEYGRPPFGSVDIGVLITKVTNELPREPDLRRVAERLQAAGWPVVEPGERQQSS